MELNKTDRITPVGESPHRSSSDRGNDQSDDDTSESKKREQYKSLSAEEAVNFGGALSSALSLNTKNLFSALVAEMEPLRAEVSRLRKRENFYREMSTRHAFLPLPNRRQFLLESEHFLAHRQELQPCPITVLIHIGSGANFRKYCGRRAADLFLKHVTTVLLLSVDSSDIVGSFGGEDFGLLCFPITGKRNDTRINELHVDLNKNPFVWQGVEYPLDATLGWAELTHNLTLEQAFEAADHGIRENLTDSTGTCCSPVMSNHVK